MSRGTSTRRCMRIVLCGNKSQFHQARQILTRKQHLTTKCERTKILDFFSQSIRNLHIFFALYDILLYEMQHYILKLIYLIFDIQIFYVTTEWI
jgi:hypothetical protein